MNQEIEIEDCNDTNEHIQSTSKYDDNLLSGLSDMKEETNSYQNLEPNYKSPSFQQTPSEFKDSNKKFKDTDDIKPPCDFKVDTISKEDVILNLNLHPTETKENQEQSFSLGNQSIGNQSFKADLLSKMQDKIAKLAVEVDQNISCNETIIDIKSYIYEMQDQVNKLNKDDEQLLIKSGSKHLRSHSEASHFKLNYQQNIDQNFDLCQRKESYQTNDEQSTCPECNCLLQILNDCLNENHKEQEIYESNMKVVQKFIQLKEQNKQRQDQQFEITCTLQNEIETLKQEYINSENFIQQLSLILQIKKFSNDELYNELLMTIQTLLDNKEIINNQNIELKNQVQDLSEQIKIQSEKQDEQQQQLIYQVVQKEQENDLQKQEFENLQNQIKLLNSQINDLTNLNSNKDIFQNLYQYSEKSQEQIYGLIFLNLRSLQQLNLFMIKSNDIINEQTSNFYQLDSTIQQIKLFKSQNQTNTNQLFVNLNENINIVDNITQKMLENYVDIIEEIKKMDNLEEQNC